MDRVRVLVIDDSAFMRKVISELITADSLIDVVGTARNGEDGIRKVEQLRPDVITLDIEMPVMDGVTALEVIMDRFPTPVVMVSSMTSESAEHTVRAMQLGAVDCIEKPSGSISLDMDRIQAKMIETIRTAARANVAKRDTRIAPVLKQMKQQKHDQSIVAIGTSTGGPRALQTVLSSLPASFPAPIVIVQHMPPRFTKSLANRLNTFCSVRVKEGEHGELLQRGVAYIAPGGKHMSIRQVGTSLAIELTVGPPKHGHRPAVDVLMTSIATLQRVNKLAVILTGMGRDGAVGITRIHERDQDAYILAEASETAIVDGMPRAAIATNVVNEIVPLHHIAETIVSRLKKPRG